MMCVRERDHDGWCLGFLFAWCIVEWLKTERRKIRRGDLEL